MRAIVVEKQGSPVAANIRYRSDWPELPGPREGWVNIRTLASAFNQMDLWVGRGVPGLKLEYPRVSGCDACGVVEDVGPGVDPAWKGRRVIVNAALVLPARVSPDDPPGTTLAPAYELIGEHYNGMMAERFSAPAANLADVGADVGADIGARVGADVGAGEAEDRNESAVEAAAFGLCALTCYSMVMTKGQLRPGQSVLITGIGGGVATAALGLARHLSCRVAVTSRHQWKIDRARELGAEFGVLDQGQDWSKDIRAWSNKRGVDMAVDSSGKATHLNCIKSLARGGAYVTPGATSGPDAVTDLARVFWNQLRLLGSTMGSNDEFRECAALFNAGKWRPVVDQVFNPEEATKAYERLEGAEQFGKIVIDWR